MNNGNQKMQSFWFINKPIFVKSDDIIYLFFPTLIVNKHLTRYALANRNAY